MAHAGGGNRDGEIEGGVSSWHERADGALEQARDADAKLAHGDETGPTIRAVPPKVDQVFRNRVHKAGKSLNEVVLDALTHAARGAKLIQRSLRTWIGSDHRSSM